MDSTHLQVQEQLILDTLAKNHATGVETQYWRLLYNVARETRLPGSGMNDNFVLLLALCNRLIKEGKIVRSQKDNKNLIKLTDKYAEQLAHYGLIPTVTTSATGSSSHVQSAILHGEARKGGVGIPPSI